MCTSYINLLAALSLGVGLMLPFDSRISLLRLPVREIGF